MKINRTLRVDESLVRHTKVHATNAAGATTLLTEELSHGQRSSRSRKPRRACPAAETATA